MQTSWPRLLEWMTDLLATHRLKTPVHWLKNSKSLLGCCVATRPGHYLFKIFAHKWTIQA